MSTTDIPQKEWPVFHDATVRDALERQLSSFLRKKRGDMTFEEFSKKVGLRPSTLHRLEQCQQSITLRSLQQVMARLKCDLSDIFGG